MNQLTVSRVAEEAGISADAVRYYERIGLLSEPDRSAAGYRLYEDDVVERLRFIKRAQRLRLRLEEIGELLEIQERGLCPCGHARGLLERRASQLDADMAAMAELRDDIQHVLDDLPEPAEEGRQCGSALQIATRRQNRDHLGKGGTTMTDESCNCGCATTNVAPADAEPCACGCECCDQPADDKSEA